MRGECEPVDQLPPRPSLTTEEQATLLTDLAAAYAVEHSQAEHAEDVATQSTTHYTVITPTTVQEKYRDNIVGDWYLQRVLD